MVVRLCTRFLISYLCYTNAYIPQRDITDDDIEMWERAFKDNAANGIRMTSTELGTSLKKVFKLGKV